MEINLNAGDDAAITTLERYSLWDIDNMYTICPYHQVQYTFMHWFLTLADFKYIWRYLDAIWIFGWMIGGWVLAMCWLQLIAGMPWMQKSESALIVHFTVALQMRIWAAPTWDAGECSGDSEVMSAKSFPILQSFTLFPAPQKYVNRMHTAQGSTRVQKFPGPM